MEYTWKHPTGIRDNIKPILIDKENKAVKVGDRVFNEYYLYKSYDSLLISCFDFKPSTYRRKTYNKEWSEFLGLPPSRYFKLFKGVMYEVFIKDDKEFIYKHCYHRARKPCEWRLKTFNDNKDWFYSLHHNQQNLVPIALSCGKQWFERNPEIIDKLKHNSYYRNRMIADNIGKNSLHNDDILNLPTSLLRTYGRFHHIDDLDLDKYMKYVTNNRMMTKSHCYTTLCNFKLLKNAGFNTENIKINRKVTTLLRTSPGDMSNYFTDIHKPTKNEILMIQLTLGEYRYNALLELFAFANIEIP